jgi:hypothetical protein
MFKAQFHIYIRHLEKHMWVDISPTTRDAYTFKSESEGWDFINKWYKFEDKKNYRVVPV